MDLQGCQSQSGIDYAIGTQDTASFQTDVTLGTILKYTTTEGRYVLWRGFVVDSC